MTKQPKLVEIRNATIWRGSTRVFDGLNLCIEQQERVAILGPNGCGKTTLLKAISRELYPVAREGCFVRVLGKERSNVWELRRSIGVVSNDLQQRYAPTTVALDVVVSGFHASIGVHGTLGRAVTRQQTATAERWLQRLGIAEYRETALKNLSTGQQRRCLLARALVHEPHTLLFDEPTAGLDLAASFDYLRTIRTLANEGRSIVLVTHHPQEIPPEVDRIVLLQAGRIVADGSKSDVLKDRILSEVYGTPMRVTTVGDFHVVTPEIMKT